MSMSDPVADLLTRIRNANMRKHRELELPSSKMKQNIVQVLQEEGFIEEWKLISNPSNNNFKNIRITLKYDHNEPVIRNIKRISKPGLRVYVKSSDLKPILNGQGISVITTSQGILTDRICRKKKIGGELICQVW